MNRQPNRQGQQNRPRKNGTLNRGGGRQDRGNTPTLTSIPSPYNFVDVEDQVARFDWGAQVSHDVPFRDGASGWLDLEVTATTPLYVRAAGDFKEYRKHRLVEDVERIVAGARWQSQIGNGWRDRAAFHDFTDFYRLPDGRPAIPGTTLRGVVRNLVEMLTNSRLGPVNDRRYAVRDLHNRELYGRWMTATLPGPVFESRVRAGWLTEADGEWRIQPCEFARVEQSDLAKFAETPHLFRGIKTLADKAGRWCDTGRKLEMHWRIEDTADHQHSQGRRLRYQKAYPIKNGGTPGTLVFTGQPSPRKHLEFVFFSKEASNPVPVSPQHRTAFSQTHTDEQDAPSESWAYWRPRLKRGERVPVFYLAYASDVDANPEQPTESLDAPGARLHAFGLAMMFRLAYKHTLHDAVPARHREANLPENAPDFTEAIFGYQRKRERSADHAGSTEGLRGRVSFGPCIAPREANQLPPVVTVLGSPKPTYYPNYFEQPFDPSNGRRLAQGKAYATLMDDEGNRRLRGWKFYPAHPDGRDPARDVPLPPADKNGRRNYRTATAFRPLDSGTVFTGRLRFHNLRPVELGALVWALTWGGREELRHRIGMAKPLGYGCARVRIRGGKLVPNDPAQAPAAWRDNEPAPPSLDAAREAFTTAFSDRLNSAAIRDDLLGMARHDHGHPLRYPVLGGSKHNEFNDAKRKDIRFVLPRWRVLDGKPPGSPVVGNSTKAESAAGGGGAKRGTSPSAGPPQQARRAKGDVVECEVVKRNEAKQKATLQIVGGGFTDKGGLHPSAKPHFERIPEVGGRLKMKIAKTEGDGYQFTFPDLE